MTWRDVWRIAGRAFAVGFVLALCVAPFVVGQWP